MLRFIQHAVTLDAGVDACARICKLLLQEFLQNKSIFDFSVEPACLGCRSRVGKGSAKVAKERSLPGIAIFFLC